MRPQKLIMKPLTATGSLRFYDLSESSKLPAKMPQSVTMIGFPGDALAQPTPGVWSISGHLLIAQPQRRRRQILDNFLPRSNFLVTFPAASDGREPYGFSGTGIWYQRNQCVDFADLIHHNLPRFFAHFGKNSLQFRTMLRNRRCRRPSLFCEGDVCWVTVRARLTARTGTSLQRCRGGLWLLPHCGCRRGNRTAPSLQFLTRESARTLRFG